MTISDLLKLFFLSTLLYGCGQTGPLYLPGTPPPIHTERQESQPVESKDAEPPKETTKPTSSENQ